MSWSNRTFCRRYYTRKEDRSDIVSPNRNYKCGAWWIPLFNCSRLSGINCLIEPIVAKSPTAVSASSLLTAINLIMIRTSILRRLRLSHPAKIVLAFLGLALFLLLPSYRPSPTFDIDQLDKATASELESQENTEISARQEAISGSGCCSAHTSSAHPSDRRGHFRPGCGDICQATSTFH